MMGNISVQLPWILLIAVAILALLGLYFSLRKVGEAIHFLRIIRWGKQDPNAEVLHARFLRHLTATDQRAKAILETKIREVWRSFSQTQWMDFQHIRKECLHLIHEIAQVYYPSSHRPELEVTVFELLKLNERITREITALLIPYSAFHKISVSTILDAKSMYQHTKRVVEEKGLRTGWQVAGKIWTGVNFINPKYWVNRVLYRGASEVVGRKVLSSIFRIVGTEAIAVFRSSSTIRTDPAHKTTEKADEEIRETPVPVIPEIVTELPSHTQLPSQTPAEPREESYSSSATETEAEIPGATDEKKQTTMKQKLQTAVAQTLNSFVEGTLQVWDKIVNPDQVTAAFQKCGAEIHHYSEIKNLPIETLDKVTDAYIRKSEWLSAAEGAATGLGGLFLLAADAVSLLGLQLRVIQQIGYCYGFDMSLPEEKLFTAKLLAESYQHSAKNEREAIVQEMRFAAGLLKGDTPVGKLQQRLFVQGFAKLAEKIGIRMGGRKVAQLLPLVGAAVGGIVNKKVTHDIALVAKEVYRDRRLQSVQKQ